MLASEWFDAVSCWSIQGVPVIGLKVSCFVGKATVISSDDIGMPVPASNDL
jgi:hypothetical protein